MALGVAFQLRAFGLEVWAARGVVQREDVAARSGVPVDRLLEIELGRFPIPTDHELCALADAVQADALPWISKAERLRSRLAAEQGAIDVTLGGEAT